jgi:hypothetical protein
MLSGEVKPYRSCCTDCSKVHIANLGFATWF